MQGPTNFLKLNTKQDFINNMQLHPEEGLACYQALYDNRMNFFTVMIDEEQTQIDPITEEEVTITVQVPQVLASVEDGVTDSEHRVINTNTEEEPVWVQQHKILDPGSLLCLKGFTEAELESILGL
jgi:hypothetical protein